MITNHLNRLPAIKYEIHFAVVSKSFAFSGFLTIQFLYFSNKSGKENNNVDIFDKYLITVSCPLCITC